MLASRSTRLGAVALGLLAAGTACSLDMSAPTGGKAGAATMQGQGKGNPSGVLMRHAVPARIALGESVTLKLQFSGVTATDGATVEVRDPSARTTLLSMRLAQGEQKTIELIYTGRTDGMQFIDVTTMQGGRRTVQSVPLLVGSGNVKLETEGQRRLTPAGEAVISLPAASPAASR